MLSSKENGPRERLGGQSDHNGTPKMFQNELQAYFVVLVLNIVDFAAKFNFYSDFITLLRRQLIFSNTFPTKSVLAAELETKVFQSSFL
jgi:hypothetical protein